MKFEISYLKVIRIIIEKFRIIFLVSFRLKEYNKWGTGIIQEVMKENYLFRIYEMKEEFYFKEIVQF